MKTAGKIIAGALAVCITVSGASTVKNADNTYNANAVETVNMEWDAVRIGGGGFVSGIVTGQNVMYARTDVGGAYKYNYDKMEWEQLFAFLNDAERGYLSVDAIQFTSSADVLTSATREQEFIRLPTAVKPLPIPMLQTLFRFTETATDVRAVSLLR